MLRHIAMFRWNADTTDDDVAEIAAAINQLVPTIPEIKRYHHGADMGMAQDNFDYVVVADFDNVEDYVTYRDNTDHQAMIVSKIAPCLAERAAVQFELRDA